MPVTIQFRSGETESAWRGQFSAAVAAWRAAERRSVAVGVRRCGLDSIAAGRLPEFSRWALGHSLQLTVLGAQAASDGYSARVRIGDGAFRVAYGMRRSDVCDLVAAYDQRDERTIGELLGFPSCCVTSFGAWWPMGLTAPDFGTGDVDGFSPLTNILLRHAGVRAVPHLPCSLDCSESERFAEEIVAVLPSRDRDELLAVLSQPMAYTAQNGSTCVEADAFRISSDSEDEPVSSLRLLRPEHAVNGFATHVAMSAAHQAVDGAIPPVRDLQLGNPLVVDLACGSGRLARRIAARLGTECYGGFDASEPNLAVARRRHPEGQWALGDAVAYRRRSPDEIVLTSVGLVPPDLIGPAVIRSAPSRDVAKGAPANVLFVPRGERVAPRIAEASSSATEADVRGSGLVAHPTLAAEPDERRQRPRRTAAFEAHPEPGSDLLVLYRRDRAEALSLNPSAQAVWQLCDGQRSVREISAELKQVLGFAQPVNLECEVAAAVEEMTARGILELD